MKDRFSIDEANSFNNFLEMNAPYTGDDFVELQEECNDDDFQEGFAQANMDEAK